MSDDFETGGFSVDWDEQVIDGGDLAVTEAAALHGTYGLSFVIDDTTRMYTGRFSDSDQSEVSFRFYIDINSLTMADGGEFVIFSTYNEAWDGVHYLYIHREDPYYYLVVRDAVDGAWDFEESFIITDEPHCIETYWKASTGVGQNDGIIKCWLDNVLEVDESTVDSDLEAIAYYAIDCNNLDAGTYGTYYVDDFVIRRDDDSRIGSWSTTLSLAGVLTSAGAITKKAKKNLSGILSFAGVVVKKTSVSLSGVLTSAGAMSRKIFKSLAGTITSSGSISKKMFKSLAGTLTSTGSVVTDHILTYIANKVYKYRAKRTKK